jgi:hypothetical protein
VTRELTWLPLSLSYSCFHVSYHKIHEENNEINISYKNLSKTKDTPESMIFVITKQTISYKLSLALNKYPNYGWRKNGNALI